MLKDTYKDSWNHDVPFADLLGETLVNIQMNATEDEIVFTTSANRQLKMYHDQDCCESVGVESVVGDFKDLIGSPITLAEESSNSDKQPDQEVDEWEDSFTWTFYKLATVKGYVDIRWYGSSSGYYSESVDFVEL